MVDAVVTLVGGKRTIKEANLDSTGVVLSGSFTNNGNTYVASDSATYETVAHVLWAGTDQLNNVTAIFMLLSTKDTKKADFRIYDLTNSAVVCEKLAYTNTVVTPESMGTISNLSSMQADWAVQIRRNETGGQGRVSAMIGYL